MSARYLGTVTSSASDGLGGWEASRHGRRSASKLPMPPGRSSRTRKLTVLDEEIRVAAVGGVASRALVGRKSRVAQLPPRVRM